MRNINSLDEIIESYNVFLFDQWGVLHNGKKLFNNAEKVIEKLLNLKKKVLIVSNSGKRSFDNIDRLELLGANNILKSEIITSGDVCYHYLVNEKGSLKKIGKKYYPIGIDYPLLKNTQFTKVKELKDANFILLTTTAGMKNFDKAYKDIQTSINLDIPLVCSNPDILGITGNNIHSSTGDLAFYYKKKGGVVYLFGKPEIEIYDYVYLKCNSKKNQMIMIGDSLFNDIAGANKFGIDSLFIKNGIHRKSFSDNFQDIDIIKNIKSDLQTTGIPDYIMDEIN